MTIAQQLSCAQRELALRRRVYPGWVAARKMTQQKADGEIAGMTAIVATLERQKYLSEVSDGMRGGPITEETKSAAPTLTQPTLI